ncbi:MAG: sigma factor, partial [Rhodanobacteraceae bacterium]
MNLRQRQFDALVHAHAGDLYRFAYWLCGDPSRAEDLVQETMLRAWRALD